MNTENQHRTLFTVVKSQSQIEAVVKATQSVVGDLEQPDTGFLFIVPVSQVYGISKSAQWHYKTQKMMMAILC
jgi:nitrogen regulatory protein PII